MADFYFECNCEDCKHLDTEDGCVYEKCENYGKCPDCCYCDNCNLESFCISLG